MPYLGSAPELQGAYEKADNISSQFNTVLTSFLIKVGTVNKPISKATNIIVNYDVDGLVTSRIILEPDVDYFISGNTITFLNPPPTGAYCWILILGDVGAV